MVVLGRGLAGLGLVAAEPLRRGDWRARGRQLQMVENLPRRASAGDEGDELHPAGALRAGEHVDGEHLQQQLGPGHAVASLSPGFCGLGLFLATPSAGGDFCGALRGRHWAGSTSGLGDGGTTRLPSLELGAKTPFKSCPCRAGIVSAASWQESVAPYRPGTDRETEPRSNELAP